MKKNKAETNETIRKLIEIARTHFTEYGYADAALESIVHEAQLTRGAVYHHFRNKKGLFRIVFESAHQAVAERVEQEASKSGDVWEQLEIGCCAFVAAAVENQNKRIMLIDGPAVLGWEVWRSLDEKNSMRSLREQLLVMKQKGFLKPVSIDAMTHLISGALNEITLWNAHNPDHPQALEETKAVISLLLEGFRSQNP
ncbi:TetR/AcrR family transcriptional regulator [Paenibacillus nasutitermitis]|uniref:TetR family transcriptional regulator n=1 Tax=Paenibacillus nasutitermitis TaxID=1652958 RepID=A0A916Z7G5_9BACL|nr:TetR/AcrR family transcriptional regulator [Paenibacillus nasutitermitis]GGD78159.1 TetR family transcriptional regulator [Paenibacillus nasutitermitis]